jgi:hypothetical protein
VAQGECKIRPYGKNSLIAFEYQKADLSASQVLFININKAGRAHRIMAAIGSPIKYSPYHKFLWRFSKPVILNFLLAMPAAKG